MSNNIIIDTSYGQTRVALMENNDLVEIYFEDNRHIGIAGNIYKGKVVSVLPGMEAAFVDIGLDKNAFLYVGDAVIKKEYKEEHDDDLIDKVSIRDVVKVGQDILVQVIKEPIGTKGPRVTVNITLPGRYLVLVPNVGYVGISRRIEDETERERLKIEIQKVKLNDFGVIIRTAAEGFEDKDFIEDIEFLKRLWEKIETKSNITKAPKLIHKDLSLIYRIVRDMFTLNIDKFVINNKEEFAKVLELAEMMSTALGQRVELYSKEYDIFEFYQIQSKLDKVLARKVWLKCGGYLVIEQTEALIVVDVNTGKYVGNNNLEDTILKANLEAAKEIAKQIRLRDCGGIIVIDFIDMEDLKHQESVIETLKLHLKNDRTKTHVVGMTQLGLVEMTRKKMRQNVSTVIQMNCPSCDGTGKVLLPQMVAQEIERKVGRLINEKMASGIIIEAHSLVICELQGNSEDGKNGITERYDNKILIKQKHTQNINEYDVKHVDNIKYLC